MRGVKVVMKFGPKAERDQGLHRPRGEPIGASNPPKEVSRSYVDNVERLHLNLF